MSVVNGVQAERQAEQRVEQQPVVEPKHVAVVQFEGANVVDHEGIIPRTVVECSEPYKRGTILRLAVELRVANVSYDETGKDGDLVRRVKFGINDVTVVSAYDPASVRENVGGSASGSVPDVDPADVAALAALGVDFSTTSGTWPADVAAEAVAGVEADEPEPDGT